MKILVTGAGGMIGRKLVERLAKDKSLNGKTIDSMTLVDVVDSPIPDGAPARWNFASAKKAASASTDWAGFRSRCITSSGPGCSMPRRNCAHFSTKTKRTAS